MANFIQGKTFRDMNLGLMVSKATAALPQGTAAAIFNIVGGRVAITQIIGEVTTIIQTTANNTKLVGNPTTGTSADICAVLDITADEVGTLYGISGLNTDAMIGINAGALPAQVRSVILAAGSLDLNCAGSATGSVKWNIFYYPIDDGAYIEAA